MLRSWGFLGLIARAARPSAAVGKVCAAVGMSAYLVRRQQHPRLPHQEEEGVFTLRGAHLPSRGIPPPRFITRKLRARLMGGAQKAATAGRLRTDLTLRNAPPHAAILRILRYFPDPRTPNVQFQAGGE